MALLGSPPDRRREAPFPVLPRPAGFINPGSNRMADRAGRPGRQTGQANGRRRPDAPRAADSGYGWLGSIFPANPSAMNRSMCSRAMTPCQGSVLGLPAKFPPSAP